MRNNPRYVLDDAKLDRLQACTGMISDSSLVNSQFNFGEIRALIRGCRELLRVEARVADAEHACLRETERAEKAREALQDITSLAKEVKQQNTDEFMELLAVRGSNAEQVWKSTTQRSLDEQDKERLYVGSTSRMITAMVQRVALAGEDPELVTGDYGWEWGRGPDLSSIAELRAKALGSPAPAAAAPEPEAAARDEISAGLICRAWVCCSSATNDMEAAYRSSPTEENALNMIAAWKALILARRAFEEFKLPELAGMGLAS